MYRQSSFNSDMASEDKEKKIREEKVENEKNNLIEEFNNIQKEKTNINQAQDRYNFVEALKELSEISNTVSFHNKNKEEKLKKMQNLLHDVLLKNSIREAKKVGKMNEMMSKDELNYTQPENKENNDGKDGKESKTEMSMSYYFPLRNEKNCTKLKEHLAFLSVKSEDSKKYLSSELNNKTILWNKVNFLRKDIIIFRRRITDLRIMLKELDKGFRNHINADNLSEHIELNIQIKRITTEKMMGEIRENFGELKKDLTQIRNNSNQEMIQLQNSVADTIVDLKKLQQIEEEEREEIGDLDTRNRQKRKDMKRFHHLLNKLSVLDELEVTKLS